MEDKYNQRENVATGTELVKVICADVISSKTHLETTITDCSNIQFVSFFLAIAEIKVKRNSRRRIFARLHIQHRCVYRWLARLSNRSPFKAQSIYYLSAIINLKENLQSYTEKHLSEYGYLTEALNTLNSIIFYICT